MNDYSGIADLYDAYVRDTRDHAFWRRQAEAGTGPILELAAGTGRVTPVLVDADRPVVCLDLSLAMVARLVAGFRRAASKPRAVAGDMCRLPFAPGTFALVVIPFNAFSELTEAADQQLALTEARRVLTPSGRLIVTLHNPLVRKTTLDGVARPLPATPTETGRLEVSARGVLVDERLARSEQVYRVYDIRGNLVEERSLTLDFVLPDLQSFQDLAATAGLRPVVVYGSYDESPFLAGSSPFMIVVLQPTDLD